MNNISLTRQTHGPDKQLINKNQILINFTDKFNKINNLFGQGLSEKSILDILFYIHDNPKSEKDYNMYEDLRKNISELSLNVNKGVFSKTYTRGFLKMLAYVYICKKGVVTAFKDDKFNVNGFERFLMDNGYKRVIPIKLSYVDNISIDKKQIKFGNSGYTHRINIADINCSNSNTVYTAYEILQLKSLLLLNKTNSEVNNNLSNLIIDHFEYSIKHNYTLENKQPALINNFICNYANEKNICNILNRFYKSDSLINMKNIFSGLNPENQLNVLNLIKESSDSISAENINQLINGFLDMPIVEGNQLWEKQYRSLKFFINKISGFKVEIAAYHINYPKTLGYAFLEQLYKDKFVEKLPRDLNFNEENDRKLFHECLLLEISPESKKNSFYLDSRKYILYKLNTLIILNAKSLNDIIENFKKYSYLLPNEYQIIFEESTLNFLLKNEVIADSFCKAIKENPQVILEVRKSIIKYENTQLQKLKKLSKSPIKNLISCAINESLLRDTFDLGDQNELNQEKKDLVKKIINSQVYKDYIKTYINDKSKQRRVFEIYELLYEVLQDQALTADQFIKFLSLKTISQDTINEALGNIIHSEVQDAIIKIVTGRNNGALEATNTYKMLKRIIQIDQEELSRKSSIDSNKTKLSISSRKSSEELEPRNNYDTFLSTKPEIDFENKLKNFASTCSNKNKNLLQNIANDSIFIKTVLTEYKKRPDRIEQFISILSTLALYKNINVMDVINSLNGFNIHIQIKESVNLLRTNKTLFGGKLGAKPKACKILIDALTRAHLNSILADLNNQDSPLESTKIIIKMLKNEEFIKTISANYAQAIDEGVNERFVQVCDFLVGVAMLNQDFNEIIELLEKPKQTNYSFINELIQGRTTGNYKQTETSKFLAREIKNAKIAI